MTADVRSPEEKRAEYERLMKDVYDQIGVSPIFTADLAEASAKLATRAGVPRADVKAFVCPCPCRHAHACFVSAPTGAWFALLSSLESGRNELIMCRFDTVDEIDELVAHWPHESDREILAVFLATGLRDALRELFVS